MRTTVSLEPDADAIVRRLMRERGLSFKAAINEAIRAGIPARTGRTAFRTPTFDMGGPAIPVDKALRLVADLEDDALIRKLAERK